MFAKDDSPDVASHVLSGHEDDVESVAFSPDERWLAVGSYTNTIRVWIAALDGLAEIGCKKVRRNLTQEEWKQYLPGEEYRKTCEQWPEGE